MASDRELMMSHVELAPDREPDELIGDVVQETARRWSLRSLRWLKTWLTGAILKHAVAGVAFVVAAALRFPLAIAAGCAAVVVGSLAMAIAARRLMYGERARRRWQEIGYLRMEQRALRAEMALDIVTLALNGDREARISGLGRLGRPALTAAVIRLQRQAAEGAASPAQPQSAARRRASAPYKPPTDHDIKAMRARLQQRRADFKAAEALLQSLADTSDRVAAKARDEAAVEARAARKAAMEADRLARDRRDRGLTATTERPEDVMTITMDASGNRLVERQRPAPTPEDVSPPRGVSD